MEIKEKIEEIMKEAEKADLQVLLDSALNEPDEDKRNVHLALFTYALNKKQAEVIHRQEFIR